MVGLKGKGASSFLPIAVYPSGTRLASVKQPQFPAGIEVYHLVTTYNIPLDKMAGHWSE
jgi:hypothetical protein